MSVTAPSHLYNWKYKATCTWLVSLHTAAQAWVTSRSGTGRALAPELSSAEVVPGQRPLTPWWNSRYARKYPWTWGSPQNFSGKAGNDFRGGQMPSEFCVNTIIFQLATEVTTVGHMGLSCYTPEGCISYPGWSHFPAVGEGLKSSYQ